MNIHMQTDAWIHRAVIVLVLTLIERPLPQLLVALGAVAAGGLVRLWISPLNQKLNA